MSKLTANKAKEILHDKSVHGHPLTDKQRKFFGAISSGAPIKANNGWLEKYADGGLTTIETTKPPFELTQTHRKGWEAYRDYLDKKGLYGDPRLNRAFGKTTFNTWAAANPQYGLNWDVLPYIGEDLQRQKQQMLQAEKKGTFEYFEDNKKVPVKQANPTIETNLKSKNTWWPGTEFTSQGYTPFEEELQSNGKTIDTVQHGIITPESVLQSDVKNFKVVPKQKYGGEAGYTDIPFNYNSAWGGQFAMGGSLPGATGMMYARIGAPSNGPHAKKTLASAQKGTVLTKSEEEKYQKWRSKLPKNLQWEGDYDLKGLWKKNPNVKPSSNLHFPDTYKLPNHPTFSNESNYYDSFTPGVGGYWGEGEENFIKNPQIGPPVPHAENGMTYYQHGLDWKPKSISKNGSDIPKNQNAQFTLPSARDLARQNMGSNESTSLGVNKVNVAAENQARINRAREAQGSIKQGRASRSIGSKALAIVTHPMTALQYKIKGQDIPENFERGERNILDNAVDIVNPFSYVDQARQVKEDINQGNYLAAGIGSLGIIPGEGAFERGAGKFLHNKKGITLDDFESAINYHLSEGLGIKKNPSNLTVKVRPGDLYSEIHEAENAPKFTVDLYNEGRHSGFIGLDKLNTADYDIPGKKGTLYTKVADYPYAFSKLGEDALKGSGISGEVNKALTNALQEYDLGKLYSSTVHTDEGLARWKNLVKKGKAKEVAPNRFELYKQGGIIKDDRGQWAHPGKITEIGSNQITMKGVPYPVLGISDLGDRKMMYPEKEYTFKGKTVTEYPQKKKNGGWLDKYN